MDIRTVLDALEIRLKDKGNECILVSKLDASKGAFKAYKTYTLEVWSIINNEKKRVVSSSLTARLVTADEIDAIMNELQKDVLVELFKYYGI